MAKSVSIACTLYIGRDVSMSAAKKRVPSEYSGSLCRNSRRDSNLYKVTGTGYLPTWLLVIMAAQTICETHGDWVRSSASLPMRQHCLHLSRPTATHALNPHSFKGTGIATSSLRDNDHDGAGLPSVPAITTRTP